MPGVSGLEVARSLREPRPHVIFVTAYDEHALAAFEAAAIDYLLKPVEPQRVAAALDRVRRAGTRLPVDLAGLVERMLASAPIPRVVARQGDRSYPVDARRVSRFWAEDEYTAFRVDGEVMYCEESLGDLANRLASWEFLRVHRAELINLSEVRSVVGSGDSPVVELADGQAARVSRRMSKELRRRLGLA